MNDIIDKLLEIFVWMLFLFIIVIFGCSLWFEIFQWPLQRERDHCVETGRQKTEQTTIPVTTYVGNTPIVQLIPSTVVYNEWKCDTYSLWK